MHLLLLFLAAAASAYSVNQEQIAFVTALVSDYKSHPKEYINFIATAEDVPEDVTKLAIQAATYKDDGYTSLLSNYDIASLESYLTNVPWYSRISAAVADADITTTAEDSSLETASAESSDASTTEAETSKSSKTSTKTSTSGSLAYDDTTKSTPTGAAAPGQVFHVGAVLGALALVLM